ncbi:hypothetical protein [Laedolimicola intestinihominis]|uniref:Uncharacterized protein n=1 Tax=Laedolimicola intestinihominis TaxID=3133166 RepID=A0ABV1FKG9_9FIRM
MRRRIKKKKGLLRDPEYEKIRACWIRELEQEMKILEELADKKEAENPEFLSELKCQLIK